MIRNGGASSRAAGCGASTERSAIALDPGAAPTRRSCGDTPIAVWSPRRGMSDEKIGEAREPRVAGDPFRRRASSAADAPEPSARSGADRLKGDKQLNQREDDACLRRSSRSSPGPSSGSFGYRPRLESRGPRRRRLRPDDVCSDRRPFDRPRDVGSLWERQREPAGRDLPKSSAAFGLSSQPDHRGLGFRDARESV